MKALFMKRFSSENNVQNVQKSVDNYKTNLFDFGIPKTFEFVGLPLCQVFYDKTITQFLQ